MWSALDGELIPGGTVSKLYKQEEDVKLSLSGSRGMDSDGNILGLELDFITRSVFWLLVLFICVGGDEGIGGGWRSSEEWILDAVGACIE